MNNKFMLKLFSLMLGISISSNIIPAARITNTDEEVSEDLKKAALDKLLEIMSREKALALLGQKQEKKGNPKKQESLKDKTPQATPSAYKKLRKYINLKQVGRRLAGTDEDISLAEILHAIAHEANRKELPFINFEALDVLIDTIQAKREITVDLLSPVIKIPQLATFLGKRPEELNQYGNIQNIYELLIKIYKTGKIPKSELFNQTTLKIEPILRDFGNLLPFLNRYIDMSSASARVTPALYGEEIDISKIISGIFKSLKLEYIIEKFTGYKLEDLVTFINFASIRNIINKRELKKDVTKDDVENLFNIDNFLKYNKINPRDYHKYIAPHVKKDICLDIAVRLINTGKIKISDIEKAIEFAQIENLLSLDPDTLKILFNPYAHAVIRAEKLENVIQRAEPHWAYRMQGAIIAVGILGAYYCAQGTIPAVTSTIDGVIAKTGLGVLGIGIGTFTIGKLINSRPVKYCTQTISNTAKAVNNTLPIKLCKNLITNTTNTLYTRNRVVACMLNQLPSKDSIYNICQRVCNPYNSFKNYINPQNVNVDRELLNSMVVKAYSSTAEPITYELFRDTLTETQKVLFNDTLEAAKQNPNILKENREFLNNLDAYQKSVFSRFLENFNEATESSRNKVKSDTKENKEDKVEIEPGATSSSSSSRSRTTSSSSSSTVRSTILSSQIKKMKQKRDALNEYLDKFIQDENDNTIINGSVNEMEPGESKRS